jgi:hypothetical protein
LRRRVAGRVGDDGFLGRAWEGDDAECLATSRALRALDLGSIAEAARTSTGPDLRRLDAHREVRPRAEGAERHDRGREMIGDLVPGGKRSRPINSAGYQAQRAPGRWPLERVKTRH